MSDVPARAAHYVAWLARHARTIVGVHVVLVALALYLIANHLPLRADFSYLLPQDATSVQDLRRLEARVRAGETVLALVEAPDPGTRANAVRELTAALSVIPPGLVEQIEADDADLRAYLSAHRHLFVPLDDLIAARRALAAMIEREKLRANPLYIDLGDTDHDEASARGALDELRAKRRDAEARLARSGHVAGAIGLVQIRTPFRATDAARGRALIERLDVARDRVRAAYPTVAIGFTGSVITAVAEHDAISSGMLWSSVITALLVALLVALYFRSVRMLVLLIGTLAIATVIAFGLAAITVGHLNAATAFLGAIIAGNGVNYGILLIARYLEERHVREPDGALAVAIFGTLRPTAIASLGAAIAYGSLAATSFRGFADFAVIGAVGMLVCWMTSYVLLPAAILLWARHTRRVGQPLLSSALVRVIGFRRAGVVCATVFVLAAIATAIVARYIAADPFEYDLKQLRSNGEPARVARFWMSESDKHFGRGIAGRTYIAADSLEQVPEIIRALRTGDPSGQTIGTINSILDVVPDRQQEKLAVLAELRALLDDPALQVLDDAERAELASLRPPDGLAAITPSNLPATLVNRLRENDGRIGLLISIRPAERLDEWNGRDLIRFANAVRRFDLANGKTVTTSGASVIFADIVESIERDGPVVTAIAAAGLIVLCIALVGLNRRTAAVLLATTSGALFMVAACALLDIKITFLDFIALPITLGLGIDYAINIAHRHDHDAVPDPIATLRTSGSAVFVCSLTTIIGYGSLLLSANLAIKGFGVASLIGEITCVLSALVLVPAILARSSPAVPPK